MATLHDDDDDAPPNTEGAEVEVENDADEKGTKEPIIDVIEDDGSDERIADQNQDADDVDEGEKPRRQKESAAERRARAKLAKERDKKELDFQRRELARQDALIKDLQKATTVNRVTELDNRITTAQSEASTYDTIHYKAIIAKNEVDAKNAADIRDAAKQRAWEAHQEKLAVIQQSQRQPTAVPPYQGLAEEFMSVNPWYDHSGRDADSRMVKEIDAQVAKEYIPTSPAYWKELQRRVQKNLPQHFQSNDDNDDGDTDVQPTQRQRKGPPTGGSSRSNSSTSTQIRLSPERVEAMKQAGAWDDPVLRTRMAKAYANYDKQNK